MRSDRSGIKRAAFRFTIGAVAVGTLTCAFATQASAASDALANGHQTGAAKWCATAGSLQNASANNKSEALATVKTFERVAGNAPNATLKHNMESFANRLASLAAHYPDRPSKSVLTSDETLERKIVSEISSVCFAAGVSSAG